MPNDVLAIVQARMSSTRLPGKVLAPLAGRAMILRQIERVLRAERIGRLVVATSTEPSDDALAAACEGAGIPVHRGSLSNVLDRFHSAWNVAGAPEEVVRLTADCPLADWRVIDACIELHLRSGADYTSNAQERSFPKGLDVEVIRGAALAKASRDAHDPYDREHVTPYLYRNPAEFRLEQLRDSHDRSAWRWTVDTPADLDMVQAVYDALHPGNAAFTTEDVAAFLRTHPAVAELNGALG